jgi:hypothetical protein
VDDAGKPISNVMAIALVPSPDPRICNSFWLSESSVQTDAKGKFELRGVPEPATFDFLKAGMSDLRNQRLEIGGAENRVTLAYGGAVKGRVLDHTGKPVRNFRVLVSFPRERRNGDQTDGYFAGYCGIGVRFTSADGRFVLTGVGAGSVYRITALADGHGEATIDRVHAVPINRLEATKAVSLRAGPALDFRVRALTTAGQPFAGARVTLVYGEPALDSSFAWGYHDASWEAMLRGRTGNDGWANFRGVTFGGATVLVQAPGYARYRVGWRDGKSELMAALAREAVVTGEVRDAAAKAVPAFYVGVRSEGDQISERVDADAMGRFRIAELPAGTWTLVITSADGNSTLHEERITLKPGERRALKIEVKK